MDGFFGVFFWIVFLKGYIRWTSLRGARELLSATRGLHGSEGNQGTMLVLLRLIGVFYSLLLTMNGVLLTQGKTLLINKHSISDLRA